MPFDLQGLNDNVYSNDTDFLNDNVRVDFEPFKDSVRLDCWLTSDDQRVIDASRYLKANIDCYGRSALIEKNLKLIIVALCDLLKRKPYGYFISYSRTADKWTKSVYLPEGISRKIIDLIDAMHLAGYLECVEGNRYYFNELSEHWVHCSARFRPTDKFIERVYKEFNLSDITVSLIPAKPLILMKDIDGNLVDYPVNDEKIKKMQEVVKKYNEFMGKYDVTVADHHYSERVNLKQNNLYRVFNNSQLNLGGRFYGSDIQHLPSSVRGNVFINGEETVELDYRANHLSFLYAREGINYAEDIGDDPYHIEGYERRLIKSAILYLLNVSGDVCSAWRALKDEYSSSHEALEALGERLVQFKEGMLEKIIERHPILEAFLNRGRTENLGLSLQYEDSCIAERVMAILIDQEIPVLPIHDSFIVRKRDQEFLTRAMVQAYHDLDKSLAIPLIKEK